MNNLISQSVKVPYRSGHYLGHHFQYTAGIGEAVPVLCHPLIPGSRTSLKTLVSASLAPLASDCYLRTSMRIEAFAVPIRFLYAGYEDWVSRNPLYNASGSATYTNRLGVKLPRLAFSGSSFKTYCKAGSLADYLGIRIDATDLPYINDSDVIYVNIFPFLAYQYLWDHWFRRADIQVPFFRKPSDNFSTSNLQSVRALPYTYRAGSSPSDYGLYDIQASSLIPLLQTWQRNFPIDYFTSALVSPQLGNEESVAITPDTADGHFTVQALRSANALQVWRERLGLAGPRFNDWLKAQYGTEISDSNGRRPMYLGSASIEFYSKGVDQSFTDMGSGMVSTNNPFKSVGARYGQPFSNGESSLIDDFTCDEPCYLMVLATVVPKVMYSSGVERYMLHYTKPGCEADLANPILQSIGNQEVKCAEVSALNIVEPNSGGTNPNINDVFGFQQRYAEYMYRNDRVSGLFRDGESLEAFVAQRYLGTPSASPTPGIASNTISNAFLRIPKNYLDQVSATSAAVSQYGVMADMYFDFGVSQPLYDSSIPSLVNPAEEHGRDIVVMRGGKRII